MKLTSQMIKEKAKELGIDCIGIGNIERFKGAPALLSPLTYFPGAKSVIAVAMRIPRGTSRGIEEGTHWHNYTFYSYNKLNSYFRPRLSYELACFIEDHGWASCRRTSYAARASSRRAPAWVKSASPKCS